MPQMTSNAAGFDHSQALLARAIGFTEADLSANRSGHLSATQRVQFEREIEANRRMSKTVGVFLVPFFALLYIGSCAFTESDRNSIAEIIRDHGLALRFGLAMLAIGASVAFSIYWSFRKSRSANNLVLCFAEGMATLSEDSESWTVRIGTTNFHVT